MHVVIALEHGARQADAGSRPRADITINIDSRMPSQHPGNHRRPTGPDRRVPGGPGNPSAVPQGLTFTINLGTYVEDGVCRTTLPVDWSLISDEKELDVSAPTSVRLLLACGDQSSDRVRPYCDGTDLLSQVP